MSTYTFKGLRFSLSDMTINSRFPKPLKLAKAQITNKRNTTWEVMCIPYHFLVTIFSQDF